MKRVYRMRSGSRFKRSAPHQSQILFRIKNLLRHEIHALRTAGFRLDSQGAYRRHCGTPGGTMTGHVDRSQDTETCRKLISLGYSCSNRVRLYGQELQLVSDPFPNEDGIAIEVVGQNEATSRTLKLPLSILQMAAPKRIA